VSSVAGGASPPPVTTTGGIVASDHEAASQAGAQILAAGGNAIDAAVATALALGVVNPTSSGIGGGGFAVVWDARSKKLHAVDFREAAPAALTPAHFVVDGKIDPRRSRAGGLAVAIPGEVAGLAHLSERLGALPWAAVVEPARRLAARGFQVSWFLARAAADVSGRPDTPASIRAFLNPGGEPLRRGQWVVRRKLAATLAALADGGADRFYRGAIAEDIVATIRAAGGVMTLADLAGYRVIERTPLSGTWGRYRVATMPLPSSGGLALLAALAIIDGSGIDLRGAGAGSSAAFHAVAEALKHTFADRARFLGDATPSGLVERFLAPARLARLARRVGPRTRPHATYGDRSLGKPAAGRTDAGTSHLCAIDSAGNAVALTTTVNTYFGAKLITGTSGIVLNNEVDDFTLAAGVPNAFGLIQSEHNLVGPGKRPLSSMTPVLVFDGDRVLGCVGGSGGPRIISNSLQVLINAFALGMDISEAVAAPRVHHQWTPDVLLVEPEVPADVVAALRRRGHRVVVSGAPTAVQAVVVDADGRRHGASDPRKGGAPAAWP
jgi:gamma-glutamyltranspeptidase/glutathione hydrolase